MSAFVRAAGTAGQPLGNWLRLVGELPTWEHRSARPKLHQLADDEAQPIELDNGLLATRNAARMASLPTVVRSAPKFAHKGLQQRALSDVAITRTGKPIIRLQGGRSVMSRPSYAAHQERRLTRRRTDHH